MIPRTVLAALAPALLLTCLSLPAYGQPVLELGTAEVLPGELDVPIPLTLSTEDDVNALCVAYVFEDTRATFRRVDFTGGVLDGVELEFLDVSTPVAGQLTIEIIVSEDPFDTVIEAGDDLLVLNCIFDVQDFQFAGTEIPLEFMDGLGPQDIDNEVFVEGDATTPDTVDGLLQIYDSDQLVIQDTRAKAGDLEHLVPILGFNTEQLGGFQIAISFDSSILTAEDFSIEDTITESLEAEFVSSDVDNDAGEAILGVLLDFLPPFDDQMIPNSGIAFELAFLPVSIPVDVEVGETVLELVDGLGDPPLNNVFVIDDDESVAPNLQNGSIFIQRNIPFLRGDTNDDVFIDVADPIVILCLLFQDGEFKNCEKANDANDSGLIDTADAIYLLEYLFQNGPQPPEPFPEAGFDRTPDDLECCEPIE